MIFEVDRSDLHRTRLAEEPDRSLEEGEARLRVDSFALTSNNITYAAFGDAMQYWDFFPAEAGWGHIPVWGFADVTESRCAGVDPGQRLYGYLPMATELVVSPGKVDDRGFIDFAAHRRPMAGAYNRYVRVDADPIHDPAREGQQMVLWPLFFTSFVIDDMLADNDMFGAATIVVSSASAKTSIGAAFLLHERAGVRVAGLTSPGNRGFVESLGCYDEVVGYDDIGRLATGAAVFVDVAGNSDVRAAVHRHYGEQLVHSMAVGGTHWDHQATSTGPLPGPAPVFFFAPTQIAKRTADWGQAELDQRVGEAWHRFSDWTDAWLQLCPVDGPERVEAAYAELLGGRTDPQEGLVASMGR
jgi:hypothetical protein